MDAMTEYAALRGYRPPDGLTADRIEALRTEHDIDPAFVPLSAAGGALAWGVPLLLQFDRPACWTSLDGRFEALRLSSGLIKAALARTAG